MLKRRLSGEQGNVVVTAILLISIMLGIGLAVLAQADTQTSQSRVERERESSFNLAEAALSAQTFTLGRLGTGTQALPYPVSCSNQLDTSNFCPKQAQLMRSYTGAGQVDFDVTAPWTTYVRDDADPAGNPVMFWEDDILQNASWARYDKAGGPGGVPNRHVWVRAEAVVRGRLRAIVAWVKIEDRVVDFPQYAILAGYVRGKNSGGHGGRPLVNSTGSLGVAVRCATKPQSSCIDLDPVKGPQIQPPASYQLNRPSTPAIGPDELQALEDTARANGTYYSTCPNDPNGAVVVIENAGSCRYTNSAPAAPGASRCCNSLKDPGLLILKRGTVDFGGNISFYGVVYNANLDNSSLDRMVETSGTAAIYGGVLVDGSGGVYAGSSGDNIVFNSSAFDNITAVGTAGVVQNTWREIVPPSGS